MFNYDVVIVGGGVSGAVAGIACARQGAKTLIVEKMGFLGGMLTAGGVGPMMTFHAGDVQVIRGIADEAIENLKAMGASPGHIIDSVGYTYTVTPFDSELLKHVLERMYTDAGGEVLYHSMLSGVETGDGSIKSIIISTKSGQLQLLSKIFIDATGDGDLSAWSGVEFQLGREKDNLCQPVTMNLKLRNVDIDRIKEFIRREKQNFPHVNIEKMDKAPCLSMGGYIEELNEARNIGEITFSRELVLLFETNNPGEVIVNTTRIQKVNPTDAWELSKAEMEGRKQALELYRFLKKRAVGFENAVLMYTGPNLGIRESRKIMGKYKLTTDDMFADKAFDDEVVRGGYPVDVHSPDGEGTNSKHLSWGASYAIPFRCLVNDKVSNLITVGRCISATHEACGSIRVTPIAMAIGQAGGTAAGMAVKMHDGDISKLGYDELRNELRENGAYIR